jgi:DMSO/TMAO reductase YedYZ molybdopterin-dependent catalytic subunit
VRRADGSRGFWAGVAGGAAAVLVLLAYRQATGMPTLPEALAERLIRLLPYQIFALFLAQLQHLAKPLGFVMAVVTSVIGFGLGGVVYAWAGRASRRPRAVLLLATALVTWLFLTYAFLPFIEGSVLGVPLTTVVTSPAVPMALASLVYAIVLVLLAGRAATRGSPASVRPGLGVTEQSGPPAAREGVTRRDVLRRSAIVLAAAAAGTRCATWIGNSAARVAAAAAQAFTLVKGMPPEVTPSGQFYQISKNFFDPKVEVDKWTLEVTGLVAKPLKLTLDEFKKSGPPVERYQTFECISNEVGGDLIGNAKWKALSVKDLLALAGVKPGAKTLIWHAADGYTESIPLDVAMDPTTLLAYEMNGEPIPQKHGAPVRVLLANRYGMKQPKWLTAIEVSDRGYRSTKGYWEQQGWSQDAYVKVNSAFRVETKEGAALALGGWAFAGNRGISKVEFSPDGGKTWYPAGVKAALGQNCWQFWSATWTPPQPGDYAIKVRATDGQGVLQPAEPKPTLPDGGQGYHTVKVHFR